MLCSTPSATEETPRERSGPSRPLLRLPWLVPVLVAVTVAVTPSLRAQVRDHLLLLGKPRVLLHGAVQSFGIAWDIDEAEHEVIPHTDNRHVKAWVEEHYPAAPEMLMAAGAVLSEARDVTDARGHTPEGKRLKEEALSLLSRAIELGAEAPAWAACAETIVHDLQYWRVGTSPHDPDEHEDIAELERSLVDRGSPQSLPPDEGGHAIRALRQWQRADPENGTPVAVEAWVLYGLHRESEALQRWKRAGLLPAASLRYEEVREARRTLLTRMGYPRLLAAGDALWRGVTSDTNLKLLAGASMGRYEGRRAQIAGQGAEAAALWAATADLGAHLQASSDNVGAFMIGLMVEARGASPVWEGQPTPGLDPLEPWRVPEPPSTRYYFGGQHWFFVEQMGEAASEAMLERLLVGARRLDLWRASLPEDFPYTRDVQLAEMGLRLLYRAPVVALNAGVVALLYAVLSLWPWRRTQRRTTLSVLWHIMLGVLTALALPVGFVATLLATVATHRGRPPSQTFGTTCRENLRRHLPIAVALGSLLYLGMTVKSVQPVETFVRRANVSDMETIIAEIGPEWHQPTILPDSWVAEYPPE